ncbi:GDP-mannose 4,6-dehydratase [Microcoleus sp. Pol11C1]|uniref:GDP-mannose 4,6-dehydratase n=1 Tax=unclassified Microcoleus TaxID=2642155 RepID=UPI002FD309A4
MNALIFGANGQDGYYLSELCKSKGIKPTGLSRSGDWIRGDVSDCEQVEEFVKEYKPTYIFHLAAKSTTRHDALFENHAAISTGTLNILEAVYKHSPTSKVFITGSGVQFYNDGNPISEDTAFEASSAYAVARIQSVYAARYYRSLGIKAYVGYLFHHESPLRKPNHVSQKIVLAAKQILRGADEKLQIGDISVEKEWTFAGDVAQGIMTLIEQDNIFEAAIGSGKTHSIKDWIEVCFSHLGLDWTRYVEPAENFQSEYKRLVSNPALMHSLHWQPNIDLRQLAVMMIETR